MSFIQEFKAFAIKGNVVDMAIGVIVGIAFGKIVSSLVADIFLPILSVLLGNIDFSKLSIILSVREHPIELRYGLFLNTVIDFFIIALCLFWVVKAINKLKKPEEKKEPEPPKPSNEEILLTEIRDILKSKNL